MPKRTKKLLVYLDQNFISEMAKADINDKVKQEWKDPQGKIEPQNKFAAVARVARP